MMYNINEDTKFGYTTTDKREKEWNRDLLCIRVWVTKQDAPGTALRYYPIVHARDESATRR